MTIEEATKILEEINIFERIDEDCAEAICIFLAIGKIHFCKRCHGTGVSIETEDEYCKKFCSCLECGDARKYIEDGQKKKC